MIIHIIQRNYYACDANICIICLDRALSKDQSNINIETTLTLILFNNIYHHDYPHNTEKLLCMWC